MKGPLETVKTALQAYLDKNRKAIEAVIGEPYSFTSPIDNVTCHRMFIQRQSESRRIVRRVARVEQWAIGGAGRDCAADRPLR
jgi:hypothetical protein